MTRTEIAQMRAEELDEAMVRLCGKPFAPLMGLVGRRRALWVEYSRQNALELARKNSHFDINRAPRTSQRRPPYEEVLDRTLLMAARSGITLENAATVAEAHLLGDGLFTDDAVREAIIVFARLGRVYGWGVRQYKDGVVEVYA